MASIGAEGRQQADFAELEQQRRARPSDRQEAEELDGIQAQASTKPTSSIARTDRVLGLGVVIVA
ncbi:hypothetical protein EP7_002884 [Isosphaeraceae bacterium EP7]